MFLKRLYNFIYELTPPIVIKIYHKIKKTSKVNAEVLYNKFAICVAERKNLPFSDVEIIAKDFVYSIDFSDCFFYGAVKVLNDYIGLYAGFYNLGSLSIRHGFDFPDFTPIGLFKNVDNYLTWSDIEKEYFCDKIKSKIYAIGAPFLYANSILSESQILKEKQRLGYNLLVYPSHSLSYTSVEFDVDGFIKMIDSEKDKFDSIRICIYWADVKKGLHKKFQEAGYECVCCGRLEDYYFLNRQRSLLEITDCVLSNDLGSHVGYSLYLKKPVRIIKQDINASWLNKDNIFEAEIEKHYLDIRKRFEPYIDLFIGSEYKITDQQMKFADDYWGFSCKKKPEEMLQIYKEIFSAV